MSVIAFLEGTVSVYVVRDSVRPSSVMSIISPLLVRTYYIIFNVYLNNNSNSKCKNINLTLILRSNVNIKFIFAFKSVIIKTLKVITSEHAITSFSSIFKNYI